MFKVLGLSLLLFAVCWSAPQSPTTRSPSTSHNHNDGNVYFVVSAKNLAGDTQDNDGLVDPFVKVFVGTQPSSGSGNPPQEELTRIDQSEYLDNDNNPQWNKVFKVRHIPGTKQLLYMEIRDHDPANADDVLGDAYIKLDDFVAKSTYTQVLEKAKSGSVTVTRTTPIYFDITVKDVPPMDSWGGLSDPYVKCYFRVGQEGKDYKFYQTEAIDDAETASWEHIPFENYQRGTNQIFHFRLKDHDTFSGDDDLGEAFLNVDTFLYGTQNRVSFTLPQNATMIISKNRDL